MDLVVNYDLFKDINNLSGNGFVDGMMKFGAKYIVYIAFVIVAALCLLRLRDRVLRPVIAVVAALVVTFVLGVVEGPRDDMLGTLDHYAEIVAPFRDD